MNQLFLLVLALSISASCKSRSNSELGGGKKKGDTSVGGGDSVRCKTDAELKQQVEGPDEYFEGVFTLDYVVSKQRGLAGALIQAQDADGYLAVVQSILDNGLPKHGLHFREFVKTIAKQVGSRSWVKAPFGLVDIVDEELIELLPPNCREVIQAVVRRKLDHKIEYAYDRKILDDLRKNRPLQFSFLIVHEWLRDFTEDAAIIRDLNWLLHQESSRKASAVELNAEFARFNLNSLSDKTLVEGYYQPANGENPIGGQGCGKILLKPILDEIGAPRQAVLEITGSKNTCPVAGIWQLTCNGFWCGGGSDDTRLKEKCNFNLFTSATGSFSLGLVDNAIKGEVSACSTVPDPGPVTYVPASVK